MSRQRAFKAVRWTAGGSALKAVILTCQLIVLSRIIAPEELGIVAIVSTIMVVAAGVSDAGVSNAIIYFKSISSVERSSLFWLNQAASTAVGLLIAAFSLAIAKFYQLPQIQPLIAMTAIVIVVNATFQQLRVYAEKELKFTEITIVEVLSLFAGACVSIATAATGLGASSVVLGQLFTAIVNSLLFWCFVNGDWRPALTFDFGSVRKFLRYGLQVLLVNLANTLTMQADVLIAGRFLTPANLAYYSLPRDLSLRIITTINPIVTRVGLPLMAEQQSDKEKIGRIYLRILRMTASVNFPIFGAMCVLAPQIVPFVFGDKWLPAVPYMQIVALWCMVRSVGNPIGSLLYATGETRRAMLQSLAMLLVVVAAVAAGSQFGGIYVPAALALIYLIAIPVLWSFIVKPICGVSFARYHAVLVGPAVCTCIAMAGAYVTSVWVKLSTPPQALLSFAVGGVLYVILSYLINREWVRDMRDFLRSKRSSAS
ncbi:MOP flippase family protein [Devosia submarina]|uniref:MOP flippase family protein n=1 Tax=Devosia submarina TaxID=1173082 RepID=UPI00130053EC|nr:MOP flippase family protein [Devosia submarina]